MLLYGFAAFAQRAAFLGIGGEPVVGVIVAGNTVVFFRIYHTILTAAARVGEAIWTVSLRASDEQRG